MRVYKVLGAVFALLLGTASTVLAEPVHGIAMHGEPLLKPNFTHFPYADPKAPKGGILRHAAIGSFDSLNLYIVRGTPAAGLRAHVFESLMARAYNEPFALYGLLAEAIETPDDRSWVAFTLRDSARFSDGKPVTVDDVVFSMETLRDKGRPNLKYYYSKIERVERPGPRTVKFIFKPGSDREIALIMGLMPILPSHHYLKETYDKTSLQKPLGSGPYVVDEVNPGARITYRRNPDYWGRYLPVNAGLNNFDAITYDYYRDTNSAFEAFKAGLYDIRPEDDPTRWTVSYDFPAIKQGDARQVSFEKKTPSGMRAMVFNTRRPVFADKRVRQALTLLFDFEWVNKNLYRGAYTRTQSFFDGSELASTALPASAKERELLAPFPGIVSDAILANGWQPAPGDASGRNRANRAKAMTLLKDAGWGPKNGVIANIASGAPLTFEILTASPADERLALNFSQTLKRAGIAVKVRNVDSSQYQQRRQTFDYDMIFNLWSASLSPGNEQSFYWGSDAADTDGTRNYMGVKEPAVDAMINAMVEARSREDFVAAVRALDRVLLSGAYVIPLFHQPTQWLAAWNHIQWPEETSLYGYRPETWWVEETN